MRRFSVFLLISSLIAAAGGFLLRSSELSNAFEPLTGLAMPNAPETIRLIMLTVVLLFLVFILAICISRAYKASESYENTFATYSILYPASFFPVWIVWISGTVLHLLSLNRTGTLQTIDIIFVALSGLAAVSVTVMAVELFQDSRSKSPFVLSIMPMVFLCFWLILLYRQNAANPVLLDFVYICLAVVAATLSFYYTAGFLYGKPAPGKAAASYCGTIYLCGVALADNHGIGISMILCALLTTSAIHLFLLLRNLERKG